MPNSKLHGWLQFDSMTPLGSNFHKPQPAVVYGNGKSAHFTGQRARLQNTKPRDPPTHYSTILILFVQFMQFLVLHFG